MKKFAKILGIVLVTSIIAMIFFVMDESLLDSDIKTIHQTNTVDLSPNKLPKPSSNSDEKPSINHYPIKLLAEKYFSNIVLEFDGSCPKGTKKYISANDPEFDGPDESDFTCAVDVGDNFEENEILFSAEYFNGKLLKYVELLGGTVGPIEMIFNSTGELTRSSFRIDGEVIFSVSFEDGLAVDFSSPRADDLSRYLSHYAQSGSESETNALLDKINDKRLRFQSMLDESCKLTMARKNCQCAIEFRKLKFPKSQRDFSIEDK